MVCVVCFTIGEIYGILAMKLKDFPIFTSFIFWCAIFYILMCLLDYLREEV